MITLTMGHEELLYDDPMGRTAMGWRPGLSESECWDRTRGLWILNENRVLKEDLAAVIDRSGTIRAVATVTGIRKYSHKRAITGTVMPGHPWVGTQAPPINDSRNPVKYFTGIAVPTMQPAIEATDDEGVARIVADHSGWVTDAGGAIYEDESADAFLAHSMADLAWAIVEIGWVGTSGLSPFGRLPMWNAMPQEPATRAHAVRSVLHNGRRKR